MQDEIVMQIVKEESESALIRWLCYQTNIDEETAERIANAGLPEGYGSLSAKALAKILPELRREVITYDKAVLAAGYAHHSKSEYGGTVEQGETIEKIIESTGEIKQLFRFNELPYYGEPLQRFVGFGTNNPADTNEKRYGRIANPTVHVGLNQVRTVVNTLIKRYGHPSEIIVEVARDLKQSREQREEENKRQAANQTRNENYRKEIADLIYNGNENLVKQADIQKMILWKELNIKDALDRRCPYSGSQIGERMLFTDQVEIEHILPFSMTLDDSLNNKTVSMRSANRDKGNRTPWQAFGEREVQGYDYQAILQRAELMPKGKRYRFAADGYQQWLREDKDFLARALNDTRYLSRVAKEYLTLICPQNTRVIPGQMTALLRAKFGLNDILGLEGIKNRNDHRHHAVDACVIGVTDQGLLQRFATASAATREKQMDKLVEKMPDPWSTYREHVKRAISHIYVSHKPDHSHEGAMHEETAWGLRDDGVTTRRVRNSETGYREREYKTRSVIPFNSTRDINRHGLDENGQIKPYKGYVGGSNFCMDIVKNAKGKWEGEIVSTFTAYQIMREHGEEQGLAILRSRTTSISGKPLVMRLQNGDIVKMMVDERWCLMRVVKMASNGQITLAEHNEANVNERNNDKEDYFKYISKMAGSLQTAKARRVTISPIGEVNDSGFKE
jgi:CRISPR-associated endonuclease Csn1